MLLIGSWALHYHDIDVGRAAADIDIVCTYDEAVQIGKRVNAKAFYPINNGNSIYMRAAAGDIIEAEIMWPGSRAEKLNDFVLYDYLFEPLQVEIGSIGALTVPTLSTLYMLKMSHRYLKDSPHFLKTMQDIKLLRGLGCAIPESMQAFYEGRMKDTYTYAHPKLNVGAKEFFDGRMTGVPQKYDHDSLHEAVKLLDKPAYTYFIDGEVNCSRAKFEASSEVVKLCAVAEESMVLALERSLVPFPGKKTPEEAFKYALMKVCTSITSGWFREFSWENHDRAIKLVETWGGYERLTLEALRLGLLNGVVKLKEEESA